MFQKHPALAGCFCWGLDVPARGGAALFGGGPNARTEVQACCLADGEGLREGLEIGHYLVALVDVWM